MKRERAAVHLLWPRRRIWKLPATVLLTRLSPRGRIDDDNLQGALKAIRDQVADELGVDDGNVELVRWAYAAERGPWGVRIQVQEGTRWP